MAWNVLVCKRAVAWAGFRVPHLLGTGPALRSRCGSLGRVILLAGHGSRHGDRMRQATTQGLYQYWNTVRGSRLAPRRYEIEPSQIVSYLSETLILEHPGTDDCRVRVAGTRVCQWLGEDLRGRPFHELWSEADWFVLSDNIRTLARHGGVGLFTFAGEFVDDASAAEFEMLLLPLTHLEERIERVLGSISVIASPAWLETSLPRSVRLTSNAVVWPDGRPRGIVDSLRRLAPPLHEVPSLRTNVRRARLVRSDRRSFLVYDGGLMDPPHGDDS